MDNLSLNVNLLASVFYCPITSLHHCCSQLHPCSVFLFSCFYFMSFTSSCVPLAVHQWLRNTTANPNIGVRLWKAWTLRLWSLKRWSPVWRTPGQPVPRVHCRYELGDKILAAFTSWMELFIAIHTSWTKIMLTLMSDSYSHLRDFIWKWIMTLIQINPSVF